MRNSILLATLVFLSGLTHAVGAVERVDEPLSFRHAMNWYSNTAVSLDRLDMKKIGIEDEASIRSGRPLRVAVARDKNGNKEHDYQGEWSVIDDMSVWRLKVQADDAKWLSFTFDDLFLPPGASLYVYNQSHQEVIGPITDKDNKAHRKFWTPLVTGQLAYIEINVPSAMKPHLSFNLKSVNQGYRNLKSSKDSVVVGACNVDVVCPQGDGWRDQIRSVASYVYERDDGFFTCTGNLVNSVVGDRKPFFMTASHCVSTQAHAQSMVFYWNLQKSSCGGPNDGTSSQNQSGATLRASIGNDLEGPRPFDMSLVELDALPNPEFNVYFSGWDSTVEPPTSGVSIHHPNGEEKRISIDSGPIVPADYGSAEERADGRHLKIDGWDEGTTEAGSSGSGFWNQDKRIVGVLSGGGASCETPDEPDFYARLASHYDVGTTPESRLKAWLDPTDTGTTLVDGLEGCDAPQVSFTINPNPAEASQPVAFNSTIAGVPDPATTYAWDFDGDDTIDSTEASPTYTYTSSYIGNVDLTVINSIACAGSSSSSIVVFAAGGNTAPVASATVSQASAQERSEVQLSASGSTDANGDDLTYQWVQTSGPAAVLSNSTAVTTATTLPWVTADTVVTFAVTVTDSFGAEDSDTVSVTVENVNQAPLAITTNATLAVSEGSSVTLDASTSSDPDGDTLSFLWVQTSGSSVTLDDSASATATFAAPQVNVSTSLGFSVTVTDPDGLSSTSTMLVDVNDVTPPATSGGSGGGSGSIGWPMLGLLGLMAAVRRARRSVPGIALVAAAALIAGCSTPETGSAGTQSATELASSRAAVSTPTVRLVKLGNEKRSVATTNIQNASATVEALSNRERRYEKLKPLYEYKLEVEVDGESEVWQISPSGYIQKEQSHELYRMDMSTLKDYMK